MDLPSFENSSFLCTASLALNHCSGGEFISPNNDGGTSDVEVTAVPTHGSPSTPHLPASSDEESETRPQQPAHTGAAQSVVPSSPLGEELGSRQARYVYLLTYSQADMTQFPSAGVFSLAVTGVLTKLNIRYKQWVVSKEQHKEKGYHYHMAIQLEQQSRWKSIKNELKRTHGVTVHFSAKHSGYATAYKYVTKCAPTKNIVMSDNHVFLQNIRTSECIAANAAKGRQSEQKRRANEKEEARAGPSKTSKAAPKSKDLRHKDVSKLIIEQRIGSLQHLQAMGELRRQTGEWDLFLYLTVHPSNKLEDMIKRVWEVAGAPEKLKQVKRPRITMLYNAQKDNCVSGCDGRWLTYAEQIIDQNPLVDGRQLKEAVKNNIDLGRCKESTVFFIGPRDCGKSFLLLPLENIFNTFSNPTGGSYNWCGIEEAECIFLNDFRWKSNVIQWADLLRLLAGERLWFERPKNVHATNYLMDATNTIPIFGTGKSQTEWQGAYQATDNIEDAQMTCRITYFDFTYTIPTDKVVRRVTPCPKCFADFILN